MCLIVFAWQVVPQMPLLAAANRDEFYIRPSAPAHAWQEAPHIFAGRDLQAGGSWMGISQAGTAQSRFAAITNIRNPQEKRSAAPSRGALVANYLAGSMTAPEYIAEIKTDSSAYNGFNLLLGDAEHLFWFSNRGQDDARNGQQLAPGIYGVSNSLLDTPWPKVLKTKAQFASLLGQGAPDEAYFDMLADSNRADDICLPETGVSIEWERLLSAVRIDVPGYGTRSSTLVKLFSAAPGQLHERVFQ